MPEPVGALLLVSIATAAGAAVQAATGFGFALIATPALFAVADPVEAVTIVLLLSLAINCLVLFSESRSRLVRRRVVGPLLAGALPGLVLGALVIQAAPKATLQVAVGLVVIVAALAQARSTTGAGAPALPVWPGYPVGLAAGALTTTTGVNGPPILLWLLRRGAGPGEVRDSLATCFLALNVGGATALVAFGDGARDIDPVALMALFALVGAGYLLGREVFRRLEARRFRSLALGLVLIAGAASIAVGLG